MNRQSTWRSPADESMLAIAHRPSPESSAWRRPSPALLGACIAGVGVGLLGWLALGVPGVARLDTRALNSFWMLQHARLAGVEHLLIDSLAPGSFVVAAVVLVAVAGLRRSPQLVAAVGFILLGANLSAEGLKAVTPLHHVAILASPVVTAGAFPSGHATACMSLVLCAVLVTPASWRPVVGGLGALYVFAVAYALLVLGNHYPSDVIAGFLVAVVWALLSIAGLRMFSRSRARSGRAIAPGTRRECHHFAFLGRLSGGQCDGGLDHGGAAGGRNRCRRRDGGDDGLRWRLRDRRSRVGVARIDPPTPLRHSLRECFGSPRPRRSFDVHVS